MRLLVLTMLLVGLSIPLAHAAILSVQTDKTTYSNDDSISFIGQVQEGGKTVTVVLRNPSGGFVSLVSGFSQSDGSFKTGPRQVQELFKSSGAYTATAFSEDQDEREGTAIVLEWDGKVLKSSAGASTPQPQADFEPELVCTKDQIIRDGKCVDPSSKGTGTPLAVTLDSSTYSKGDTIKIVGSVEELKDGSSLGVIITGPAGDIVAARQIEPNKDRTFSITVPADGPVWGMAGKYKIVASYAEQKNTLTFEYTLDSTGKQSTATQNSGQCDPNQVSKNGICVDQTSETAKKQGLGVASFVEPGKDPQHYVDRYHNEPEFKAWFDQYFGQYSSIYQAVGLPEPNEEKIFPDWVRNSFRWYGEGKISDEELLNTIQFLIKEGIVRV